jgi:hypothetical protein
MGGDEGSIQDFGGDISFKIKEKKRKQVGRIT